MKLSQSMKTNAEKKKEIDAIVAKYRAKFAELKKRRDKIVAHFVEALKQKRLEEIKAQIKQL